MVNVEEAGEEEEEAEEEGEEDNEEIEIESNGKEVEEGSADGAHIAASAHKRSFNLSLKL